MQEARAAALSFKKRQDYKEGIFRVNRFSGICDLYLSGVAIGTFPAHPFEEQDNLYLYNAEDERVTINALCEMFNTILEVFGMKEAKFSVKDDDLYYGGIRIEKKERMTFSAGGGFLRDRKKDIKNLTFNDAFNEFWWNVVFGED